MSDPLNIEKIDWRPAGNGSQEFIKWARDIAKAIVKANRDIEIQMRKDMHKLTASSRSPRDEG